MSLPESVSSGSFSGFSLSLESELGKGSNVEGRRARFSTLALKGVESVLESATPESLPESPDWLLIVKNS